MSKLTISYETIQERDRIINILSTGIKIKKISKPYEKGKYKRIYVDIE